MGVKGVLKSLKGMINNRFGRYSFSQILALSYTFFLIIPIAASLLVYHYTENIVADEITRMSETQCTMTARQVDSQATIIDNVMSNVSGNQHITNYIQKISDGKGVSNYETYLIPNELKNARINIYGISDIYIYFRDADRVISGNGVTNKKIAYDVYGNKLGRMDEWNELMNRHHSRSIIPWQTAANSSQKEFAYVQSLPFDSTQATLVITVSSDNFLYAQGVQNDSAADIYVLSGDGSVIAQNSEHEMDDRIREKCMTEDGVFYHETAGGEYAVACAKSDVIKDIRYVLMFPKELFLSKVSKIRTVTYASLLGVLMLGIWCVFYFSRKNAEPVKNMIDVISAKLEMNPEECMSEYNVFVNSVKEKLSLNDRVYRDNRKMLMTYFLHELLTEECSSESDAERAAKAAEYGIYYEEGSYVVALLSVYNYERFFEGFNVSDAGEKRSLTELVLTNIIEDMFSADYHCVTCPLDRFALGIAVIVNVDKGNDVENIISGAYDIISSEFGIYFTAAISAEHSRDEWNEAYSEALSICASDVFEYGSADGNDGAAITTYSTADACGGYILSDEVQKKLYNTVCSQNADAARSIICDILRGCINMPPDYMINIKFAILDTLLKALPSERRSAFCRVHTPAAAVSNAVTPDAVKQVLIDTAERIIADIGGAAQKSGTLFKRVSEFTQRNYSDVGLSIVMIADHMDMNPHYLSKCFKAETGESLRDYINKYRIDAAKNLLLESNMTMKEIAEKVGFIDNNAFIRVFKKYEGVTPGVYRKTQG